MWSSHSTFSVAGVWATLVLMTVSALCGAATDLQFNPKGYMWQLINCLFTAAYALTLRNVMDKVGCSAAELSVWSACTIHQQADRACVVAATNKRDCCAGGTVDGQQAKAG